MWTTAVCVYRGKCWITQNKNYYFCIGDFFLLFLLCWMPSEYLCLKLLTFHTGCGDTSKKLFADAILFLCHFQMINENSRRYRRAKTDWLLIALFINFIYSKKTVSVSDNKCHCSLKTQQKIDIVPSWSAFLMVSKFNLLGKHFSHVSNNNYTTFPSQLQCNFNKTEVVHLIHKISFCI